MQVSFDEMLNRVEATFTALPDKPEETPTAVLKALWLCAQGQQVSTTLASSRSVEALTAEQSSRIETYLAQLDAGTPVAHIVGRQNFCGLELLATEQALIPRVETELLVNTALSIAKRQSAPPARLVDLCCGCGNIALALASHLPGSEVYGSDMSEPAIDLAMRNAEFTQLSERVSFFTGDMLAPFESDQFYHQVDIMTCNPPYISSAKVELMPQEISAHEPKLAFDGGPFGMSIIQKLISKAPSLLKPNGWLVFEVGLGQAGPLLKRHAKNPAYQQALGFEDAQKNIRVIAMQVQG